MEVMMNTFAQWTPAEFEEQQRLEEERKPLGETMSYIDRLPDPEIDRLVKEMKDKAAKANQSNKRLITINRQLDSIKVSLEQPLIEEDVKYYKSVQRQLLDEKLAIEVEIISGFARNGHETLPS